MAHAQCLEVASVYQRVRTAGFVVDSHNCYRSLRNSVMKFPPCKLADEDLYTDWPDLVDTRPYSTVYEALKETMCPGYNTVIVRLARPTLRTSACADAGIITVADHLVVNYSFWQALEILQGRETHCIGAFANANCSCKSKSHVGANFSLRPSAMCLLERSGYGIHSIVPQAPSLGLALMGRSMLDDQGEWQNVTIPVTLYDTKPAPFQKFSSRLQAFKSPTLSIMARCTCFNIFIVSVMPYTASYFGLSTYDPNLMRQQAVKFILKRNWLEAEIFPYVLRYVGIAPLMDPALAATVAATGLYFREGNTFEDLIRTNLSPTNCNLRQRSIVQDLLMLWSPFVKLDSMYSALSQGGGGLKGRIGRLKQAIFQGMSQAAQARLRRKVTDEGWSRGVSYQWLEMTAALPKKWCNGIARYALLRWVVNQDDDVWLSLRGTRHQRKCSICSSRGNTFLAGHTK